MEDLQDPDFFQKSGGITVEISHEHPRFPSEEDKALRWEEIAGKLRQILSEAAEKQALP